MKEEQSNEATIVADNGNNDDHPLRPWHKPPITRIEIKRTRNWPGSGGDGGGTTSI